MVDLAIWEKLGNVEWKRDLACLLAINTTDVIQQNSSEGKVLEQIRNVDSITVCISESSQL